MVLIFSIKIQRIESIFSIKIQRIESNFSSDIFITSAPYAFVAAKHGDLTTNAAMILAKPLGQPPQEYIDHDENLAPTILRF